jgi:tRNA A64-2'-O-ribosylphosphate transferase
LPLLYYKGLTPEVFWANKETILNASRMQIPVLVTSLVSSQPCRPSSGDWIVPPSPVIKVAGRLLLSSISDLPLLLPSQFPDSATSSGNAAYLLVSTPVDAGSNHPDFGVHPSRILRLQVPGGKKGQIVFLQVILQQSMDYIQRLLISGNNVCIACDTGRDLSVGIALAAIQRFFDDSGDFIMKHQYGMPRPAHKTEQLVE